MIAGGREKERGDDKKGEEAADALVCFLSLRCELALFLSLRPSLSFSLVARRVPMRSRVYEMRDARARVCAYRVRAVCSQPANTTSVMRRAITYFRDFA